MADRGVVKYVEAENQYVNTVPEKGYFTRLCDIILTNLNERDSYNKATDPKNQANASANKYTQLGGISDKSKETEVTNAKNSLNSSTYLKASDANTIIKYTEELVNTLVDTTSQVVYVNCEYPKATTISPVASYTVASGSGTIIYSATDTGNTFSINIDVPQDIRVIHFSTYNTHVLKEGTHLTIVNTVNDKETGESIEEVIYDSADDLDNNGIYVYVDYGESLSLDAKFVDGDGAVGVGIVYEYGEEINYITPSISLSEDESFVLDIESGEETHILPSTGESTIEFTPKSNVMNVSVGEDYTGNELHIVDQNGVYWINYSSTGNNKLPSIVNVDTDTTYTLNITGDADASFVIKWDTDINFKKPDQYASEGQSGEEVNVCSNTSISCPNRETRNGYKDESSADEPGYVIICTNTQRPEVQTVGAGTLQIPRVNADEIVYAQTWTYVAQYLRQVSDALNKYKGTWDTIGACVLTCQVKCQASCQLVCQSCYGGTCHNQNCGGMS